MGGNHDYEVKVMYGALIEFAGSFRWFFWTRKTGTCRGQDRDSSESRPAEPVSLPMIWCKCTSGLDSCAVRENFN